MSKKKEKNNPFFRYLSFCLVLITVLTLILFKFIDVLPGEYFIILCILLGVITIILCCLINVKRGPKKRAFGLIFSIIYLIFLILVIIYEINTIGFLKKLGFKDYKTENYSLVVLNTSTYEKLADLDKALIGSLEFDTEGLKKAKKKLEKKISPEFIKSIDITELKNELMAGKINAMLIEKSLLSILLEDDHEFASLYKIIYDFSVDVELGNIANEVNITKDAFNIYVSGIDTYGSVSSVSRSDVNMVISVNPKTHQILITSIPRDYYVSLAGKSGKDKLTHAGIYGIETSVKTIEQLLDIKINYFIKVNFTSVVKLVDALGGVDVNSKYDFTSIDGIHYNKGINHLKGTSALSFVRERKAFNGGDRVRGENQVAMIEAIINKAISPSIIIKYNSLLDALDDLFITNLNMNSITEFIKMQIDDNPAWDVSNIALDGTDSYQYTYSYRGSKLYVMLPNEETVISAKNKITLVFN